MNKTPNYGLNKPEETDFYNINDFNENSDKLDETLKVKANLLNGKVKKQESYPLVQCLFVLPETGEENVIYIVGTLQYKWENREFIIISPGVALGETSTTAYRGDMGKSSYEHTLKKDNPHSVTAAQVGSYSKNETYKKEEIYSKQEVYSKTEMILELDKKANSSDVYTKIETFTKDETKIEIQNKINIAIIEALNTAV